MKTQKNSIFKYILFAILRIGLWVYIFFGVFLYFMQSSILYYPSQEDFYSCSELENFEKLEFGETRLYYKNMSDEKALIHYHGNAWRACDRAFKQDIFLESWRNIVYVEYSWFGWDSIGPNMRGILQNTHDISKFAQEKWYDDIIIYWESLGSAVASYHASHSKVERLVLVSPFTSVADVAVWQYPLYPVRLLLRENYTTQDWLKDFSWDVDIIHGAKDSMISPHFSKKLYDSLHNTRNKEYHLLENLWHNNMWFSENFLEVFSERIK